MDLIQTILDYGHTFEDLQSGSLTSKIVKLCWPDGVDRKCTASELNSYKARTRIQWEDCVEDIVTKKLTISKHIEETKAKKYDPKSPVAKKFASEAELLEEIENPKNRIVGDKPIERTMNFDLMAELGIKIEGSND